MKDDTSAARDLRLAELLERRLQQMRDGGPLEPAALSDAANEECRDAVASLEFIQRVGPMSAPAERAEFQGEALGDYRIVREVGRGGMGVVYEAEERSLHRRVALKVLPFAAVLDAKQLQRFHNEAQAAAQLHHPNIVPVYSAGCDRGVHYYAMQFIEGESVARAIRELQGQETGGGRTPASSHSSNREPGFLRMAAVLGAQAAEALDHAHQLGVVHRDVKPANLIVDVGGNVWVTDFGLAHLDRSSTLTLSGDLIGTIRYMSPEQALGKRAPLDHRTDVYSLGATLYELLTLEPAVTAEGTQEALKEIATKDPRPPRRLNPAIPVDLETIILKALSKEPANRYATAQEMADDLRRFVGDQPVLARRPSLPDRAARWARRHRAVVGAGVLLLVLLVAGLAVGAWLLAQEQRQTEQQRRLADERRQEAEANFLTALEAIDAMLAEVGSETLKDVPLMEPVRKRLLERALALYEGRLAPRGADPRLVYLAAKTRHSMGVLYQELGESERALKEYHAVLAMLAGQAEPKCRYEMARCLVTLARLQLRMLATSAAGETLARARGVWQALVDEDPSHGMLHRAGLARTEVALSDVLNRQGRRDEAVAALRGGLEIHRQVAAGQSDWSRMDLISSLQMLGVLLQDEDPPLEALACMAEARDILTGLLQVAPESAGFRFSLADVLIGYGPMLERLGRQPEAHDAYASAVSILEPLIREFPHIAKYRSDLAVTRQYQGILLCSEGKIEEGVRRFREQVQVVEQMVILFPRMENIRRRLANSLQGLVLFIRPLKLKAEEEEACRRSLAIFEELAAATPVVEESRERVVGTKVGATGQAVATFPAVRDYRTLAAAACRALGHFLERCERYAEAEKVYLRGIELAPSNPDHRSALAYLLVVASDPAFRDPERALGLLAEIPDDKWDPEKWMVLGAAQYRAERFDEAGRSIERAMAMRDPPGGEEWFFHAMLLWRKGDLAGAQAYFGRAAAWRQTHWPWDEEILRLEAETAAVLRGQAPVAPR